MYRGHKCQNGHDPQGSMQMKTRQLKHQHSVNVVTVTWDAPNRKQSSFIHRFE